MVPKPDAIDLQLIRAASLLLGRHAIPGLTVRLTTPKRELTLTADADDVARAAEPPPADGLLLLACACLAGEQERAVLEVLRHQELKADAIARQLGRDVADSSLRAVLSLMADRGLIASGRNGYGVTDPRIFDLLALAAEKEVRS